MTGISEERLHHMIGVARKAYEIARQEGFPEPFCRKMFMIGWNHDVGYEFSEKQPDHCETGAEMLMQITGAYNENVHAVQKHGHYSSVRSDEWRILNMADMLIDHDGKEVDVIKRLDGIKERYGEYSDQYLTACDICVQVGLTAINLAEQYP